MRGYITICLSLIVSFSFAQFAIIADKDGFCNVRTAAQKGTKVIDQLENGHLVYCFPDNTNWIDIDYTKNNKDLNGQVYKDRVIYISSFTKIPVLTKSGNSITLKKDSINVFLNQQNLEFIILSVNQ